MGVRIPLLMLLVLMSLVSTTYADPACDNEQALAMKTDSKVPFKAMLQLQQDGAPLNAAFSAIITLCAFNQAPGTKISFDAPMPAHKHGMNYEPDIVMVSDYVFEVNNLLFHMPGIWQLEVTMFENGSPHRFTYNVNVQ